MIERNHDEDEKSFHDRLNAATDKLRERRDAMYEQLSARGSAAASGARDAARASRSAHYDNPLVGGFVAALLGAVAGAVIPSDQKGIGRRTGWERVLEDWLVSGGAG